MNERRPFPDDDFPLESDWFQRELAQEYEKHKPGDFVDPGPRADEIARAVIGAAINVHSALGPGYMESVYEKALAVELTHRGVSFKTQVPLALSYRGVVVGEWRLDMLIDDWVIVELKSVERLTNVHTLQAVSYLRVTELPLALLINFNVALLKDGIKRVVPRARY